MFFQSCEKLLRDIKAEAPVFKKEHIVDKKGSETQYWISENRTINNTTK